MMQKPLKLSVARRLAVYKQGLMSPPPSVVDAARIQAAVARVGLVQIDAVNAVERSHRLVIFSRIGQYKPEDLQALQRSPIRVIEQWAHAACLIPVEHYRWWLPLFSVRQTEPLGYGHRKALGAKPEAQLVKLMARIRECGPLSARSLESKAEGTWWRRSTERAALDLLHYRGELALVRDANLTCSYDLSERVLPKADNLVAPSFDEAIQWMTVRGIEAQGVATAESAASYYRLPIRSTRAALEVLMHRRKVVQVEVAGWTRPAFLSRADIPILEEIQQSDKGRKRTTFLSPFDSLIWDRERVRDLFSFSFRNYMYMPAHDREVGRFGYYVMPILHGDRLVGRMDPRVERRQQKLTIRWIEVAEDEMSGQLVDGLRKGLRDFANFVGCEDIQIEASSPHRLKRMVAKRDLSRRIT